MGKISRAGNERLRALFVSGATSIINAAMKPGSRQMTEWLQALLLRKPRKLAAVALANKNARTAWAMDRIEERFGITFHVRSIGKLLRRLNFRRISVRPRHPETDEDEQEGDF